MKVISLVAGATAVMLGKHRHHHYDEDKYYMVSLDAMGIDEGELMSGNHWRELWPRGATDAGQLDDTVVPQEGKYRGRRWTKPTPVIDYGHNDVLDKDVIDTLDHLETYEAEF